MAGIISKVGIISVVGINSVVIGNHFDGWIISVAVQVPGVVVRPHLIHVLGDIANGLIAAASGACIC